MQCPDCDVRMKGRATEYADKYNVTWRRYKCPMCGGLLYSVESPTPLNRVDKWEVAYDKQLNKRKTRSSRKPV